MDTATNVKPATGRSPPPPPLSSSLNAESLQQFLDSTTDDGDRNVNNLLGDDNNQRLSSLTERFNSLGKSNRLKLFAQYPFILSISYLIHSLMSEGRIPPPHSSLSNAAEEILLLDSTTDDGDRNVNNLLGDDNNQRLSSLSERLSGLGKYCD